MPKIDITQAQADALARGEDITVKPPTKTYVLTFLDTGNVFEVRTTETPSVVNERTRISGFGRKGESRKLRSGSAWGASDVSTTFTRCSGFSGDGIIAEPIR